MEKLHRMKKAVITGATGMLGATLARELLSQDVHAVAIIRPCSARRDYLPEDPRLETIDCALADYPACPMTGFADCPADVFYHFAWDGTNDDRRDPVVQTQNIVYALQAMQLAHQMGCSRFVGVGSQAEYGLTDRRLAPESRTCPVMAYGAAKLAASYLCGMEARRLGIEFIWARVFSIYGPMNQGGSLVMTTIRNLLAKNPMKFTKGEQQWAFLYSKDAARAFRLIGEHGNPDTVYCVGHGNSMRLVDMIREIYRQLSSESVPPLGALPYAGDQVMFLQADIGSLPCDTGFLPQIPFDRGIFQTIQ
jgi:UDP-glucose 4-epimerase